MSGAYEPTGAYLRPLPDPWLPARASRAAAPRARRLQAFLRPLQRAAAARLELHGETELWVVDGNDWDALTSAPYGWPFTRTRETPASAAGAAGPTTAIVVAAEVPGRWLKRFEPVLLAAARAGVAIPDPAASPPVDAHVRPPGPGGRPSTARPGATLEGTLLARADARELLDLATGVEWGHAIVRAAGLRTRVAWLDELVATALFLTALREAGEGEVARRFLGWAEVQVAGGRAAAAAGPPREGRRAQPRRGEPRRDLEAFVLPRGRQPLAGLVGFQGAFALRAGELVRDDGWAFLARLRSELDTLDLGRGRDARSSVAQALVRIEPGFASWLRSYGVDPGAGA